MTEHSLARRLTRPVSDTTRASDGLDMVIQNAIWL
jgi:hypothetical protein